MEYSVGEVSKLTRLSVRALHHYDEIGLVKPSGRSAAGYRIYTDRDLERLQTVLFYRELGFKLEDILSVLNDPKFDRRKALIEQRSLLSKKLDDTRAVLALVERTLRALDGEVMDNENMFDGFDVDAATKEAEQRWGNTESFKESQRRTKSYKKEDWARMKSELNDILDAFVAAAERGVPAADAADIAERHRLHIDKWFYPCSREMHAALGKMYVDAPRFAANYESRRAGLAEYVRDAVLANSMR